MCAVFSRLLANCSEKAGDSSVARLLVRVHPFHDSIRLFSRTVSIPSLAHLHLGYLFPKHSSFAVSFFFDFFFFQVKFILSGHCHRNYEARVRRPIVPKTPPRSTAVVVAPPPAAVTTTDHATSGDDSNHGDLLPPSTGGELSAPAADEGIITSTSKGTSSAAQAGVGNPRREAEAETEGNVTEAGARTEAVALTETTEREARAGGDVDSEDAPGSISDNDEVSSLLKQRLNLFLMRAAHEIYVLSHEAFLLLLTDRPRSGVSRAL